MKSTFLAIRCQYNAKNRVDVTHAFRPECNSWADNRGNTFVEVIDNHKSFWNRNINVKRFLDNLILNDEKLEELAIFCHGWKTGIQIGFNNSNVQDLAERLAKLAANDHFIVSLYCCSVGKGAVAQGDNSFADLLRDHLCKNGIIHCRVMGHTKAGHTTQNPNVRFFDGHGSTLGGIGAPILFPPKTPIWRAFKRALDDQTDFRFVFPLWSTTKIVNYLEENYLDQR